MGSALELAARLLLGLTLLVAGIAKLWRPSSLDPTLDRLGWVRGWLRLPAVRVLGIGEILAGLVALLGWFGVIGAIAVGCLLAALTFALLLHHSIAPDEDCGCIAPELPGGMARRGFGWSLKRNLVLSLLALYLIASSGSP